MDFKKVLKRLKVETFGTIYLLLIVVVLQFLLSRFSTLSSWKGGGFAMFSEVSDRMLSCEAKTVDGQLVYCRINFRGIGERGPLNKVFKKSLMKFPTEARAKFVAESFMKYQHKIIFRKDIPIRDRPKGIITNGRKYSDKINTNYIKGLKIKFYQVKFDHKTATVKKEDIGVGYTWGEWN